LILWEVLASIYDDLGRDRLGDGTFRALDLARVIEPPSNLDTVRVLTEIGVASPHRVTFMRCFKRVVGRDYRAGMLSAANLLALEEGGFRFIAGSRAGKIPYELEAHVERHGNYLAGGATIETTRRMGTGKNARDRRVACHYAFKRAQHDNKAINAMAERAEKVASGERPLKKDRFVTFTDTHRRQAGDRPAPHPRRGPNPPQRPRLEWSLNRYNSGQVVGLALVRPVGPGQRRRVCRLPLAGTALGQLASFATKNLVRDQRAIAVLGHRRRRGRAARHLGGPLA
jgi:hypothetical protein